MSIGVAVNSDVISEEEDRFSEILKSQESVTYWSGPSKNIFRSAPAKLAYFIFNLLKS